MKLQEVGPPHYDPAWDDIGRFPYYDRHGNRISLRRWTQLFEFGGLRYWRIGHDRVRGFSVSTVWRGLDHGLGNGKPLIFETMVFEEKATRMMAFGRAFDTYRDAFDIQFRYSTAEAARKGHCVTRKLVRKLAQSANGPAPLAVNGRSLLREYVRSRLESEDALALA